MRFHLAIDGEVVLQEVACLSDAVHRNAHIVNLCSCVIVKFANRLALTYNIFNLKRVAVAVSEHLLSLIRSKRPYFVQYLSP